MKLLFLSCSVLLCLMRSFSFFSFQFDQWNCQENIFSQNKLHCDRTSCTVSFCFNIYALFAINDDVISMINLIAFKKSMQRISFSRGQTLIFKCSILKIVPTSIQSRKHASPKLIWHYKYEMKIGKLVRFDFYYYTFWSVHVKSFSLQTVCPHIITVCIVLLIIAI